MVNEEPVQRIHDEVELEIERIHLGNRQKAIGIRRQEAKGNREKLMPESIIKNFVRPFDLVPDP
jgi:hypothetical protein